MFVYIHRWFPFGFSRSSGGHMASFEIKPHDGDCFPSNILCVAVGLRWKHVGKRLQLCRPTEPTCFFLLARWPFPHSSCGPLCVSQLLVMQSALCLRMLDPAWLLFSMLLQSLRLSLLQAASPRAKVTQIDSVSHGAPRFSRRLVIAFLYQSL